MRRRSQRRDRTLIWQSGAETGSDGTGRRPWTEASLRELHQRLLAARLSYRPPEHLLTELNEEYRGFVANHDGKSGYYQWLALLVRELAPGLILELGSFLGVSALMMLSELGEQSRRSEEHTSELQS